MISEIKFSQPESVKEIYDLALDCVIIKTL